MKLEKKKAGYWHDRMLKNVSGRWFNLKGKRKLEKKKQRDHWLPKIKMRYHLLLYAVTILLSVLAIWASQDDTVSFIVAIVTYVFAGCGLFFSSLYLIGDLSGDIREIIHTVIEEYGLLKRLYHDYHFRTVVLTSFSFLMNVLYAGSNAVYGIIEESPWLGTLAAYYMSLSAARFWIICYAGKKEKTSNEVKDETVDKIRELNIYRNTGIVLIFMTIVLIGAVILLIHREGGYSYSGYLIFVVALYTFYKAIVSVYNIVRARKMKSTLLVTIRNIGYADALVSVLALQTAMFTSFGNDKSDLDPQIMNGMTGGFVCLMILLIGTYMAGSSHNQKRRMQN